MTPRRVAAVLLAVFLNLALVPCTMALEVVEEGHDCCPPELRLDPSECCQIDVGSNDTRSGIIKVDLDGAESLAAPAYVALDDLAAPRSHALPDPPVPPRPQRDLNALFCVYLK